MQRADSESGKTTRRVQPPAGQEQKRDSEGVFMMDTTKAIWMRVVKILLNGPFLNGFPTVFALPLILL